MADLYRYVVGVDTHAATHSYAIVHAPNGALIDQATFPTTPAGLRRARDWIGRRTGGDLDGVLVAAEGTGSYGAVLGDVLEAAGYQKGRQGALLHKPDFIGATLTADLPQVLSEGEQTALGLAGFFTEAHFDQSRSTLVLDDPVTSLDHERRGRVAERLVDLAKTRQVIVFTHDATFAAEVKRCAGEENIEFTTRTIERGRPDQQPGACRDDHPWAVKDAPVRLGWLKQDLARIKKNAADWDSETYDREVAMWAGYLSETWERFIQPERRRCARQPRHPGGPGDDDEGGREDHG